MVRDHTLGGIDRQLDLAQSGLMIRPPGPHKGHKAVCPLSRSPQGEAPPPRISAILSDRHRSYEYSSRSVPTRLKLPGDRQQGLVFDEIGAQFDTIVLNRRLTNCAKHREGPRTATPHLGVATRALHGAH